MGIRKTGNRNGPVLTYSEESGKGILEKDGLFFKDLTGDGRLYPYEDWRLSPEEGEGFGFKAFCPRDCRTDAPQRPTDAAGLSYRISGRGDL